MKSNEKGLWFLPGVSLEAVQAAADKFTDAKCLGINYEGPDNPVPIDLLYVTEIPVEVLQDHFEAETGHRPLSNEEQLAYDY